VTEAAQVFGNCNPVGAAWAGTPEAQPDAVGEARATLLDLALSGNCCEGFDTEHTPAWKAARSKLAAAERAEGAK
jgi:hypothetical protein